MKGVARRPGRQAGRGGLAAWQLGRMNAGVRGDRGEQLAAETLWPGWAGRKQTNKQRNKHTKPRAEGWCHSRGRGKEGLRGGMGGTQRVVRREKPVLCCAGCVVHTGELAAQRAGRQAGWPAMARLANAVHGWLGLPGRQLGGCAA